MQLASCMPPSTKGPKRSKMPSQLLKKSLCSRCKSVRILGGSVSKSWMSASVLLHAVRKLSSPQSQKQVHPRRGKKCGTSKSYNQVHPQGRKRSHPHHRDLLHLPRFPKVQLNQVPSIAGQHLWCWANSHCSTWQKIILLCGLNGHSPQSHRPSFRKLNLPPSLTSSLLGSRCSIWRTVSLKRPRPRLSSNQKAFAPRMFRSDRVLAFARCGRTGCCLAGAQGVCKASIGNTPILPNGSSQKRRPMVIIRTAQNRCWRRFKNQSPMDLKI
mmetsp:Transcript_128706/g.223213  ORF Transcript_128706/g.223213 Transcript_128706/m.223213 type:complete len:270 (+) Transcript_128706:149-958(+)